MAALALATPTVAENTAPGATVSAINGKTALSTLSLFDDAGGRFAISGTNLLTGLTNIDYEAATSYNVTVRESLAGATNAPRDTVLAVAVTDVAEGGLSAFAYETETNTLISAMTATGTTPNSRRQYTLNHMVKRLKDAGIWAKLNQLYLIADTEAHWQINLRNPGTNNLTKVGAPTFTANTSVGNGASASNYYDTGVTLASIGQNDHSFGFYCHTQASSAAADMGAFDGSSRGISLRSATGSALTVRSMTTVNSESATKWGSIGFQGVSRLASGLFSLAASGMVRTTFATASVANVSTNTVRILNVEGTAGARDLSFAWLGAGLTDDQLVTFYAIITHAVFCIQQGDIEIYEPGYLPASPTYDVVVYGATAQGAVFAYEMARQGKSVAIVGGWRERSLGGVSANGLGRADVDNAASIEGLPRWIISRIQTIGGSAATEFQTKNFAQVMRELFDPAKTNGRAIPVYWSNGVTSVSKTGARINSFTTVDGRTFNGTYFVDATYEGDLLALSGVSFVTGREAAGTGPDAANGWRATTNSTLGSNHQFKDGGGTYLNVDPFIIPGNSGSGLIAQVETDPGTAQGTADNYTQAYNFRLAMSNQSGRRITFSSTPPAGYNVATYEALLRYFALYPAAGTPLLISPTTGNTYDVNSFGGMSTDKRSSGRDYVAAASYAARETVWTDIRNYIEGLIYLLAYDPDSRIPASVRTTISGYGWDPYHFLDPHPNDPPFFPGQLYVREYRRLVGSLIWTGTDLGATDGTTPRSTNTAAVASYGIDSHHSAHIAWNNAGTWSVRSTGNFEATSGGTNKLAPLPIEIFLPQKAECENLSVPFCASANHVAFGSIRMEFSTMVAAQSLAVYTKLAIDGGNIALQDVPYATARTAILATPSLSGETTPALPQVN